MTVTALPADDQTYESVEIFEDLAVKIFRRKRTLDYDNFDQFKSDSRALLFVEKVQINKDQICSAYESALFSDIPALVTPH